MSKSSVEASLCSRVSVWASFASMMFFFNQIVHAQMHGMFCLVEFDGEHFILFDCLCFLKKI